MRHQLLSVFIFLVFSLVVFCLLVFEESFQLFPFPLTRDNHLNFSDGEMWEVLQLLPRMKETEQSARTNSRVPESVQSNPENDTNRDSYVTQALCGSVEKAIHSPKR